MASIHLNKLHFACLALHPNTVSQRISSKLDTEQRSHSFTKPWWYLTPVQFEFWTGMQNSGNISSFSVSGFPWAAYFGTSVDRSCSILFCDDLVIGATTLPRCSGPAFFYHFWQGKVSRKRWFTIYTHPLSDEGLPKFSYYYNRKSLSGIRKKIDWAFRNMQPCHKRVARKLARN